MEKGKNNLKNQALQKKVREMLEKARKNGLIKSHTEAFKNNPVSEEEHKGKKESFLK